MQSSEQKGPRISEVIRGWMGWCPQEFSGRPGHSSIRNRVFRFRFCHPGLAAPAPTATGPVEYRPEYQTNLLLILLFLGGLFYASNLNLIMPFNILSAVLVYFDAENIHAGYKFEEVSLLGEVATWRPDRLGSSGLHWIILPPRHLPGLQKGDLQREQLR